jgi:hypothetical protein
MSYYLNVFDSKFTGIWALSDRQYSVNFSVNSNGNNVRWLAAWNNEPYDLSTKPTLTFNYSFDFKNYATLAINASAGAVSTSAVKAFEVAAALNANATFAALMLAYVTQDNKGNNILGIKSLRTRPDWRVYISGTSAEQVLRFNKRAGIAELPTYFTRHTISNANNYPDAVGMLQLLDATTTQDQQILNEASLSYVVGAINSSATVTITNTSPFVVGDSVVLYDGAGTTVSTTISSIVANTSLVLANVWTGSTGNNYLVDIKNDYQLLRGRSGLFNFQKITVDGSDRITIIIEYPAGALVGDLGRKIAYTYTGAKTHPDQITEIPYVLTSSDLIIP